VRLPLRDAVAVITGAGSGIGRATALAFAARGTELALSDRDADGLAVTVAAAESLGVRVTGHHVDVTDHRAVTALPAAVVDAHGRVTVLVNNAGVALTGAFANTSLDEFRWLTATNLDAVVAHTHAFLPELLRQPAAQIVIVSSLFGLIAPAGQVAYATAKFGVRGFGEALRHELAGTGTGVTLVHPGGIATAIARNARVAGRADQVLARTVTADFDRRFLRIPPQVAGERIARAVERRRRRVLIGADARVGDLVQRLAPARYWDVLGRGAPPAP
jgi:short-subunit dehydrogenase